MVRDTSLEAYREDRLRIRDKIVQTMSDVVWTRRELAREMDMEASSMSGRINELMKEGRVVDAGYKTTCQVTGRMVQAIKRRGR